MNIPKEVLIERMTPHLTDEALLRFNQELDRHLVLDRETLNLILFNTVIGFNDSKPNVRDVVYITPEIDFEVDTSDMIY